MMCQNRPIGFFGWGGEVFFCILACQRLRFGKDWGHIRGFLNTTVLYPSVSKERLRASGVTSLE